MEVYNRSSKAQHEHEPADGSYRTGAAYRPCREIDTLFQETCSFDRSTWTLEIYQRCMTISSKFVRWSSSPSSPTWTGHEVASRSSLKVTAPVPRKEIRR